MSKSGEVRRIAAQLNKVADEMDQSPIGDEWEEVYTEHCISIYQTPDYEGDALMIEHTCRDDLGAVLITEGKVLYDVLMAVVENSE